MKKSKNTSIRKKFLESTTNNISETCEALLATKEEIPPDCLASIVFMCMEITLVAIEYYVKHSVDKAISRMNICIKVATYFIQHIAKEKDDDAFST